MKLEELLKEVLKLNKQNELLHTGRPKYLVVVVRDLPTKSFNIYKKSELKEISDYYISAISNEILNNTYTYLSTENCYTTELTNMIVDVYIEEVA